MRANDLPLTSAVQPAAGHDGNGERVLLIDDDPVARLLTASALATRGWTVIEGDGGAQVLPLFAQHQPDVVVLDALMPDIDGFTACERLRRLPAGAHVPVLMLTGLDDEHSIARAYEAGATDFFVKSGSQWTLLSERLRYMLRASRMRAALAESQAKLSKAQRIARLGTWEWDLGAHAVRLSDECFTIAGLARQEAALADWFLWTRVAGEDQPRLQQSFAAALAEGSDLLKFECRIERPSGQLRVVHVEAELLRDESGCVNAVHGVAQDITERVQAEDQIRQLANFDSLTGLPNRRLFRDQFGAALERAQRSGALTALMVIDLDRFKQVNDTLGHQVGDQLLREMARRLTQALRDWEAMPRAGSPPAGALAAALAAPRASVARLGGDEFNVVLTELPDAAAAERAAQQLLAALGRPVHCGGHELFVTASIGVAVCPQHGADVDALVRKADLAMYAAKERGRDGWLLFDESMNAATTDRWRVENALHRALERQELVLHYQPKVSVDRGGAVVGAEALMRWQRDGVLVPPGEFISAAEETGLIVPITEWAIGEVCRQLQAWRQQGVEPVPVSVNISSRHMQRADLSLPVAQSLAASGLDPALLELELTETVLMQNLDQAAPLLAQLKQLGVSLSIDDFGTGYSSLAYLKRLPIDTLKIDRSFVRDLESSEDNAAIVAAIIAMSRSLKLRVVAEGVETAGQMRRLAAQGCTLMQGWLFAKAMDAERFRQVLAEQQRSGRCPLLPATAAGDDGQETTT